MSVTGAYRFGDPEVAIVVLIANTRMVPPPVRPTKCTLEQWSRDGQAEPSSGSALDASGRPVYAEEFESAFRHAGASGDTRVQLREE
jgi:hypothetical protein